MAKPIDYMWWDRLCSTLSSSESEILDAEQEVEENDREDRWKEVCEDDCGYCGFEGDKEEEEEKTEEATELEPKEGMVGEEGRLDCGEEYFEQDYYDDGFLWDADQADADTAKEGSPALPSPRSPTRVSPSPSVVCLEGEALRGAEDAKEAEEQETKKILQQQLAETGQSVAEKFAQALLVVPQASRESLLSVDAIAKQQHQKYTAMMGDMPIAEFRSHKTEQLAAMIETWRSDTIARISDLFNTTPQDQSA